MQRRAAAAYTAIFVVIAVGASAGILAGWAPQILPHLWAIAAMSIIAAVVLLATAYMPVRRD